MKVVLSAFLQCLSKLTLPLLDLHSLLTSVVPEAHQYAGNLNPDALKRLSEKLGELVGEDAVKGFNQARNERGEVCSYYTSILGLLNRSYSASE
jgi:hypothetical protein